MTISLFLLRTLLIYFLLWNSVILNANSGEIAQQSSITTLPEVANHSTWHPPEVINVFCEPPNGGFGDVASNLLMAQLLAQTYPDSQINIIYSRTSEEAIARLVKSFATGLAQQKIGRFNYFNLYSAQELPHADILFQFSSENVFIEKIAATAPLRLVFSEFARNEIFGVATENYGFRVIKVEPDGNRLTLIFATGIDNGGIYISPQPQQKPMVDDLFRTVVYQNSEKHLDVELLKTAEVAFAYVSSGKLTQAYNQAIYNTAKKTTNKNKIYLLFSKEGYHTNKSNKPENVIFIPINSFPLDLSREVISRATLPIFITGDVSLNFAIDAAKPFFYEQQSWKLASINLIQSAFAQLDASIVELLGYGLHIKPDFNYKDLADFQTYFESSIENKHWQTRFQMLLQRIRSQNSLIENIAKNLPQIEQTLATFKTPRSYPADLEKIILNQWSGAPIQRALLCSELIFSF